MAAKRRKIVVEDLNLGYGATTIPTDSGGTRSANKIGIHSLIQNTFNVQDFGATGDGTTDDTAACQAAIDAACAVTSTDGGGVVIFPSGRYLITSTLDCTNSRVAGTKQRDGLTLCGEGRRTVLLGKTGAGKAIIETTGSQYLRMSGFWLDTTIPASGKSTIGILQAVGSVLTQTQNQHFHGVFINMHDDATANASVGTVGIWNYGAEENTYGPLWIRANVAVVLTSSNDGTQPGPLTLTSYQTLSTTHSLTMTTFTGECFLNGLQKRNAPIIIQNITTIEFENTYIADTASGAGTNNNAIFFMGNANNFHFNGLIEVLSSIRFDGSVSNSSFNITWGTVDATTTGALLVNRTKTNKIQHSIFRIDMEANFARAILTTLDGNESATSSYSINNTEIFAYDADGSNPNLYVPVNVATNTGSLRIGVRGATNRPTESTFAAGLTSDTANNTTGDGTAYSLNALAFTEDFDIAGAFDATTGIFTAKLSGHYQFTAVLSLVNVASGHNDAQLFVNANSQQYQIARINPGAQLVAGGTEAILGGSVIVFLTTGQTAFVQIKVAGSTKTVGISSGGTATAWRTRFQGTLIY